MIWPAYNMMWPMYNMIWPAYNMMWPVYNMSAGRNYSTIQTDLTKHHACYLCCLSHSNSVGTGINMQPAYLP